MPDGKLHHPALSVCPRQLVDQDTVAFLTPHWFFGGADPSDCGLLVRLHPQRGRAGHHIPRRHQLVLASVPEPAHDAHLTKGCFRTARLDRKRCDLRAGG